MVYLIILENGNISRVSRLSEEEEEEEQAGTPENLNETPEEAATAEAQDDQEDRENVVPDRVDAPAKEIIVICRPNIKLSTKVIY